MHVITPSRMIWQTTAKAIGYCSTQASTYPIMLTARLIQESGSSSSLSSPLCVPCALATCKCNGQHLKNLACAHSVLAQNLTDSVTLLGIKDLGLPYEGISTAQISYVALAQEISYPIGFKHLSSEIGYVISSGHWARNEDTLLHLVCSQRILPSK